MEEAKYKHVRYGPIFVKVDNKYHFSHIGVMTEKDCQILDEAAKTIYKEFLGHMKQIGKLDANSRRI